MSRQVVVLDVVGWRSLREIVYQRIDTNVITRSEIRYGIARLPAGCRRDDSAAADRYANCGIRLTNPFTVGAAD